MVLTRGRVRRALRYCCCRAGVPAQAPDLGREVLDLDNVVLSEQAVAELLEVQPLEPGALDRAVVEVESVNVDDGSRRVHEPQKSKGRHRRPCALPTKGQVGLRVFYQNVRFRTTAQAFSASEPSPGTPSCHASPSRRCVLDGVSVAQILRPLVGPLAAPLVAWLACLRGFFYPLGGVTSEGQDERPEPGQGHIGDSQSGLTADTYAHVLSSRRRRAA
jgi:hypothetical protein